MLLAMLELAFYRVGRKCCIMDVPDARSSHTVATLRGGGVVFLFAMWLYCGFYGVEWPWLMVGVSIVGIVSFVDDVRSLHFGIRLLAQFAAVLMMLGQLGMLDGAHWLAVAVALVVCVGIVNAFNFMDGINGILVGYSLTVLASIAYVNECVVYFIDRSFMVVTALSLVVFALFNFRRRALCFAGDVGSITIAFILTFMLARLILVTGNYAYIVFMSVYGVDAVLTICHRIYLREHLGDTHRKHVYQIMANELRMPHLRVSALYMTLQLVISAGFIIAGINGYIYMLSVVAGLAAVYMWFINRYYRLHRAYLMRSAGTEVCRHGDGTGMELETDTAQVSITKNK